MKLVKFETLVNISEIIIAARLYYAPLLCYAQILTSPKGIDNCIMLNNM